MDFGRMEAAKAKIALLIDADNVSAGHVDFILSELRKYGVVEVRRAYGNWKKFSLQRDMDVLHAREIQMIHQRDYTKGKNATDITLAIDAVDLLYTHRLDAFCIVSSDSDFTPLAIRILKAGLKVYGFGNKKTPPPFVQICSEFTYLKGAPKLSKAAKAQRASRRSEALFADQPLIAALRRAVTATSGPDGWSAATDVGARVVRETGIFFPRHGYQNICEMLTDLPLLFRLRRRDEAVFVREKGNAELFVKPTGAPPEPVAFESLATPPPVRPLPPPPLALAFPAAARTPIAPRVRKKRPATTEPDAKSPEAG
jgi:uncharacterized LabA/DUF88 family protein